jgi:hypothetical protein
MKRALIKTLLNWVHVLSLLSLYIIDHTIWQKVDQSTDMPSKPVIPPRPSKKTSLTDIESARLLVESTATISNASLLWFTKPTLASICDAKNERRSGNKNDLVGRLLDWVCRSSCCPHRHLLHSSNLCTPAFSAEFAKHTNNTRTI